MRGDYRGVALEQTNVGWRRSQTRNQLETGWAKFIYQLEMAMLEQMIALNVDGSAT